MITNRNNQSSNFYTEGFGISFPQPLTIRVEKGSLCTITNGVTLAKEFPQFEFDVELSTEFPVIYDVYLLDSEEEFPVHIDRTELANDTIAFYEGEEPLLHTILTFVLEPNATSLDTVEISFNNVVITDET